jgi:hypothetical protein
MSADGPLSDAEVAEFLHRGFYGAQRCLAAPGELEDMNE